jgi:hypothetical protein
MGKLRLPKAWPVGLALVIVCAVWLVANRQPTLPNPPAVRELASLAQVLMAKDPILAQPVQRQQFEQLASRLETQARNDPNAPYWRTWQRLNDLTVFLHSPDTSVYFSTASRSEFPLAFVWTADGIAVSPAAADIALFPADSQLVTLGGLSPQQLLSRLQVVLPGNPYWVRRLGQSLLPFPYLLYWIGALSPNGQLSLTVQEPSGRLVTRSLTAVEVPAQPHLATSRVVRWSIDTVHGYGLLCIYTMAFNRTMLSDLKAFFTAVKQSGVKRILIDVRSNTGGNSCVTNAVLVYLPSPAGVSQCGLLTMAPDQALMFHGQVIVAQGWATSGSAALFTSGLSALPEVTIVGAPTGGNPSGDIGNVVPFQIAGSSPLLRGQVGTHQFCLPQAPQWSPGATLPTLAGGCFLIESVLPRVSLPLTLQDLRSHTDPVTQWMNAQP